MSDTFLAAMATRATDAATVLPVGTRVRLHSLSSRPELNGRVGTIVRPWRESNGRYGVLVDGFSALKLKCIAMKPPNLSPTAGELRAHPQDEAYIKTMYQTSSVEDIADVITATCTNSALAESAVRALMFSLAQVCKSAVQVPGAASAIRALLRCMEVQENDGSVQTVSCIALVNVVTNVEMIKFAVREGVIRALSHALTHPQAQPSACMVLRNLCTVQLARAQLDSPIISAVVASIAVTETGLAGDVDEKKRAEDGCFALCNMLQLDLSDGGFADKIRRTNLAIAANAADVISSAMIWWSDDSRLLFAAIMALEALCSGSDESTESAKEQLANRCCLPIIVAAVEMRVDSRLTSELSNASLSGFACSLIAKLCSSPRARVHDYSNMTLPTSESNFKEQNPRAKALVRAGAIEAIVRSLFLVDWSSVLPGDDDAPRDFRSGLFALESLGCCDHPSDGGIEENNQRALVAGAHPNWLIG